MLHREPFRSQVYKPFLSIWWLCLRGRPMLLVPTPPLPPPVAFVPQMTLEPHWVGGWGGLPRLRRFLSVGPELRQTSCSSAAVPLLEGLRHFRCSDCWRWQNQCLGGANSPALRFPPIPGRAAWASSQTRLLAFPSCFFTPQALIGLLTLLQLYLLFKHSVWSIMSPSGLSHRAGS